MASEVSVKFGAQLDQLIDGVAQAKDAIESIKESTDRVTDGFKTLAEIAGVSLSLEGFKNFVESMAELGERTETSMARLGQSADQITQLQGIAKVSGTAFEGLQAAIEKGSLTVQKSTKDGYNPAAQALRVLGISAKELIGLPADQWFLKISDAVSKFNPSLNLTNAVTAAFGRGAAQMLPLLLQGSEHFKEMAASVRAAQEGLAAAIPGMANTQEKISLLGLSLQSLGARIFSVLKPAIDAAITSFTKWVQSIDTTTIINAVQRVSGAIITIIQSVGNFAISVMGYIDNLGISLDEMMKKLSLVVTGAAAGGILGSLGGGVGAIPGALLGGAVGAGVDQVRQFFEGYDKAARDGQAKMEQRKAALEKVVTETKAVLDSMTKGLTTPQAETSSPGRQDAGGIDAGLKNTLSAQATRIEEQIAAEQAKLSRIKEILNEEAAAFKITENQKAVYTETAIAQAYQAEMALIAQKEKLYQGDVAKYAEVEKEKAKLTQAYQQDMLKTVQESQKQMTATITSGLQTFTSAFNSQLRGLLAGTTTWAQAFKNIAADLFLKLIELVEQWAVKHAATMIADAVLSKTTAAQDVVTHAAAEAAKTEAAVTGSAARAAAETTGASAGIAAQIANAITSIGIDAGKAFAGVFGFLAPVMGPAAAGPAASAEAATFAGGLAPLATGAWEIPGVMGALLHPGEMVVPAPFASGIRSAASGGGSGGGGQGGSSGPNINFSFSQFVGNQAFINSIMPQLARSLRSFQNLNPSTA